MSEKAKRNSAIKPLVLFSLGWLKYFLCVKLKCIKPNNKNKPDRIQKIVNRFFVMNVAIKARPEKSKEDTVPYITGFFPMLDRPTDICLVIANAPMALTK